MTTCRQVSVVIMIAFCFKTGSAFLELGLESVTSETDQACHTRVIMGFAEHLLQTQDCWGDFTMSLNLSGYQSYSCGCKNPSRTGLENLVPTSESCTTCSWHG